MSDPTRTRVHLPSGAGAPEPFNANDVLVWNTLICKYICRENRDNFNRSDFLQEVINGRILRLSAYDKAEIRNAIHNRNNHFNVLIEYCLRRLQRSGLFTRDKKSNTNSAEYSDYLKTNRLAIFCPEILKYDMLDIEALIRPLANAEKEIRSDENYSTIISLLNRLRARKIDNIKKVSGNTEVEELKKLNQLGIIVLTLGGGVSLSPIGEKVVRDLLDN